MALLLAFALLAGPLGGYTFTAMRANGGPPGLASLVLALALIGAGSKAGLVPLHVWLPLAHPAAPSHVSALMSGVMTKVAIYGFVRIVFDLIGPLAWWWSLVVLALGGITAAMGVLYALMQHDLKRLLAYHTVENIGIIFVGLGARARLQGLWHAVGRRAGAHRGSPARIQSFRLQELAVLWGRRCADGDRGTGTWSSSEVSYTACRKQLSRFSSGASLSQHCRHSTASSPSG